VRSKYRAVFARGGTSKALIFHERDLPADRAARDALFLSAMGSPDAFGRQLDGMGGGISSLSKVCIVGPSTRADADVDYTFVQVQIDVAAVDYGGNCGNMSSAIGPFAVEEGLVVAGEGQTSVRIHNVNTGKVIVSVFPTTDGRVVESGDLIIPGVSGSGAAIRLDFQNPGGASTGKLLPTGRVVDRLRIPGFDDIEASLIDAANACVFVAADSMGLTAADLLALEGMPDILGRLAAVRAQASVAMGISKTVEEASQKRLVPLVALVAAPQATRTLSGEPIDADAIDLVVRMISNGQPHRALPLTGSLCTAVACLLPGSVPAQLVRARRSGAIRLGMPSGVLEVNATVEHADGVAVAHHGSFYRTSRRLFEGHVYA
jgi:2-methylaconitate cis-trans-isomerase PrpF